LRFDAARAQVKQAAGAQPDGGQATLRELSAAQRDGVAIAIERLFIARSPPASRSS